MLNIDTLTKSIQEELSNYFVKDDIIPNISVIVPCYNVENYLVKCLNSIIKQSLKDIEIICVDDGSKDSTPEILKIYENFDKRIKIITQENQKLGAARNNGFAQANGEYVSFIDSDDWIDTDFYEKLYAAAKKYNSDIALADYIRIGNGKTKKRLNFKTENLYTDNNGKFEICNQAKHPCSTNKIFKTEFLKKYDLKFPAGVICEDKIFTCKAIYYANAVVSVPGTYYYYYRRPNSIVKTKNEAYEIDKQAAYREELDFLRNNNVQLKKNAFWAIKKAYKIFNQNIYVIKESLHAEVHLLFGFLPIFYKKIV